MIVLVMMDHPLAVLKVLVQVPLVVLKTSLIVSLVAVHLEDAANEPVRGRDLQTEITITFEEAAFGLKKDIVINRQEECSTCAGTGAHSKSDIETCSRCNGSGRIITEQSTLFGRIQTQTTCPECYGKGKTIKRKCEKCSGSGKVESKQQLPLMSQPVLMMAKQYV